MMTDDGCDDDADGDIFRQNREAISHQKSQLLSVQVVRLSFPLSLVRPLCRRCRFRPTKHHQESFDDADTMVVVAPTL